MKMMRCSQYAISRRSPRRGVALLIVLWMMAILTLLMYAFLGDMQVEYAVSGGYGDGKKAEQLAWSAIDLACATVMNDTQTWQSLNDTTWYNYRVGFPTAGRWLEVLNTDVYDHWVNPTVVGNGGAVEATGEPLHGFEASCAIVIPANAVVVFAKDHGD